MTAEDTAVRAEWVDVPPAFRQQVLAWAEQHKGKLYAPIAHPQLSDIKSVWQPSRFEHVRKALPAGARTALDVGSHWGFFATGLARLGLEVTAVEANRENARFLREIARLSGAEVRVEERSVFELGKCDYDVVLALNIFHHFLRQADTYEQLIRFLERLTCRTMIYQAHAVDGRKMQDAYARIPPEEMCDVICRKVGLGNWELIETFNKRKMFRIY